jgi:DNA-binding transcriptional LysR family regulator
MASTALIRAEPSAPVALPPEWRLRQQVRLRHLLLLEALERHGSPRRAATDLTVTQPAATKLLAQLEALLGLPLFDRSPQGLAATEYGRIMTRHARAALGELGAARDALAQTALGAQGQVAIGAVVGSLPVRFPADVGTIGIVTRRRVRRSTAAAALVEQLRSHARLLA